MHDILNGEADSRLPVDSLYSASLLHANIPEKTTSHNQCTAPRPTPRLHLGQGSGGKTDHKHSVLLVLEGLKQVGK